MDTKDKVREEGGGGRDIQIIFIIIILTGQY